LKFGGAGAHGKRRVGVDGIYVRRFQPHDRLDVLLKMNAFARQHVHTMKGDQMAPKTRHRLWLLLLPYIGLLWVPFYNFRDPLLFGIPFFYWYQLAWVPVSALLTWIAYRTYSHED